MKKVHDKSNPGLVDKGGQPISKTIPTSDLPLDVPVAEGGGEMSSLQAQREAEAKFNMLTAEANKVNLFIDPDNLPDIEFEVEDHLVGIMLPVITTYFEGTSIKKSDAQIAREEKEMNRVPNLIIAVGKDAAEKGYKVGDYIQMDKYAETEVSKGNINGTGVGFIMVGNILGKYKNKEKLDQKLRNIKEYTLSMKAAAITQLAEIEKEKKIKQMISEGKSEQEAEDAYKELMKDTGVSSS